MSLTDAMKKLVQHITSVTLRSQVWLPGQVPLLNLAWFLPSLPGLLLTVVGVTHSLPPSPPSPRYCRSLQGVKKWPFWSFSEP